MEEETFIGRWRIVETSAWDMIDLDENEAYIEFRQYSGVFVFEYIHLEMDVIREQIDDLEIVGFSFLGNNEGDEVTGWGWFKKTNSNNRMEGKIYFHHGG